MTEYIDLSAVCWRDTVSDVPQYGRNRSEGGVEQGGRQWPVAMFQRFARRPIAAAESAKAQTASSGKASPPLVRRTLVGYAAAYGQVLLLHLQLCPLPSISMTSDVSVETRTTLLPAYNKGGPYFTLLPAPSSPYSQNDITACDHPTCFNNFDSDLHFPLHENCSKILEWVAEAKGIEREDAWGRVHGILEKQLEYVVEINGKVQPVTNLANAGKFGTRLGHNQELVWQSYPEGTEEYEANPLEIPDLADLLASAPNRAPYATTLTFTSTPSKMANLAHPILPHIMDLSPFEKDSNWDKVMEMLSSKDIIEPREGSEMKRQVQDIPFGLRNQRRIWALVEDLLDPAGATLD
ncbi:MAG: hypothetical protein Q9169_005433 [Polycauliona sp. 2 TL-2023]